MSDDTRGRRIQEAAVREAEGGPRRVVPTPPPSCENCRYAATVATHAHLMCRRYPQPVQKHSQDLCGEFSSKEPK